MRATLSALLASLALTPAASALELAIGYLEQVRERPPVLSNLDPVPEDEGLAGARLGLSDNATTGGFLGHDYTLAETVVEPGGDLLAAAREMLGRTRLVVVNAPMSELLAIADLAEAEGAILVNAGAPDNALREEDCRANLLHSLPSRSMLTDALAQFAVSRRWGRLAMIAGPQPEDALWARSFEASAAKFGLKRPTRKDWAFDADMRRNASAEVPLFTQDLGEYDLLVVADEANDFARYVLYNTWLPRPVAGGAGIAASAWSPAVEQHGAAQLQNRFVEAAGRQMRPVDYAAWVGVRIFGEAATRTGSADPGVLRAYILSDAFELGGFKGRALGVRSWDGQVRQPVPLSHPEAVVAIAPMDGFLHQRTELDTLGRDMAESPCTAFSGNN